MTTNNETSDTGTDILADVSKDARPVEESLRILDEQDTCTPGVEALIEGPVDTAVYRLLKHDCRDEAADLRSATNALAARIAELEQQVEQAGVERHHQIVAELTALLASARERKRLPHSLGNTSKPDGIAIAITHLKALLAGCDWLTPEAPEETSLDTIKAQAAKAERAQCVAELRKLQRRNQDWADEVAAPASRPGVSKEYDLRMQYVCGISAAADHLEASGRAQG